MQRLSRLSAADRTNLAVEAPDTPMHQAALAVLEGGDLLDAGGHVRIDAVRAHLAARLRRVPELTRVYRPTPLFHGGPLWADDPTFRIEEHVMVATLPAPGGDAQALAFTERRMQVLMDRTRPLWEIWFLEGYAPGRVGILIKLHHALSDGPSMLNLVAQVFSLEPAPLDGPGAPWRPSAPPTRRELLRDSLERKLALAAGVARRLRHPVRFAVATALTLRAAAAAIGEGRGAPRTSLNRPIAVERRVGAVRIPLDEAKSVAHVARVKLNDVFLAVIAGALRQVLTRRGEPVAGVRLHSSMAVTMHPSGDRSTTGNLVGTMIVPLPVGVGDARVRLEEIAKAATAAKTRQQAVLTSTLMVALARSGLTRLYIRRQHMVNLLTTNLPGPPVPLYLGAARLVDAVAIPPIAGNVTVSFAALSYDGTLNVSFIADAAAWPDFDLLPEAVRSSWLGLRAAVTRVPVATGPSALSPALPLAHAGAKGG